VHYRATRDLRYHHPDGGYTVVPAGATLTPLRPEDLEDQREALECVRALRNAARAGISPVLFLWEGRPRYAAVGDGLEGVQEEGRRPRWRNTSSS
jgi:hypothetical protein